MARGTVFQEIRSGAGFKIGHFVKETSVGLPQSKSCSLWIVEMVSQRTRERRNESIVELTSKKKHVYIATRTHQKRQGG